MDKEKLSFAIRPDERGVARIGPWASLYAASNSLQASPLSLSLRGYSRCQPPLTLPPSDCVVSHSAALVATCGAS